MKLLFINEDILNHVKVQFKKGNPELKDRGQLCCWLCALTSAFDFATT